METEIGNKVIEVVVECESLEDMERIIKEIDPDAKLIHSEIISREKLNGMIFDQKAKEIKNRWHGK